MSLKTIVIVILSFLSIQLTAQSNRIYINNTAVGSNNGISWADAYTDFQTAIDSSNIGDTLWLAAGIYIPSYFPEGSSTLNTVRDKAFVIGKQLTIYGGFIGNETSLTQRDYLNNSTILSGDVNQDDNQNLKTDNLYHVVMMANLDTTTVLDGIIIESGYADNGNGTSSYTYGLGARDEGAGLNCNFASPTIRNCIFRDNFARQNGGAVYGLNPKIIFENCTFDNNTCNSIGTNFQTGGGAIHVYTPVISSINTRVRLSNCIFTNNSGGKEGGALFSRFTAVDIYSCLFDDNYALQGGAIFMQGSTPLFEIRNSTFENNNAFSGGAYAENSTTNGEIYNCKFLNNSSGSEGGALSIEGSGSEFINCTFVQNTANNGGAVETIGGGPIFYNCLFGQNTANGGGNIAGVAYHDDGNPKYINCTFSQNVADGQFTPNEFGVFYNDHGAYTEIKNCISWGNTLPEFSNYPLNPSADMITTNSIIESASSANWNPLYGNDGGNNIDLNPQFLNANTNYVRVSSTSPAIDAGDNSFNSTTTDLALQARVNNNIIDIGAFEFGNYTLTHQYDTICNGDSAFIQNTYLSETGDYSFIFEDTITGIDSVILVHLTEVSFFLDFINISACNNYTINGQVFNQSTFLLDTLISSFGCDSVVVLTLTINNSDTITLSETICENDSFQVFDNFYHQTGNYTTIGQKINGCDSVVILDLTVNEILLLDTIISNTGSIDVSLSGDTLNYQYIWSNGATTQDLYQLTTSGIYTLSVIDTNGCTTDFSIELILTNLKNLLNTIKINVSPNPSKGEIFIEFSSNDNPFSQLKLFSINGKEVYSQNISSSSERIDISHLSNGIYFLQFQNDTEKSEVIKIIKN